MNSPDYKEIYEELRLHLEAWMERTSDPLLGTGYRVPKPEGAWVNRLQDLDPECTLSEYTENKIPAAAAFLIWKYCGGRFLGIN